MRVRDAFTVKLLLLLAEHPPAWVESLNDVRCAWGTEAWGIGHWAWRHGDVESWRRGCLVPVQDDETPLIQAARVGDVCIVRLLLQLSGRRAVNIGARSRVRDFACVFCVCNAILLLVALRRGAGPHFTGQHTMEM